MASFKTVAQIAQEAIKVAGLVTGTGVQTYTEPLAETHVKLLFESLWIKRYWEWMSGWHTFTIADGTFSVDVDDVIKNFEDIKAIFIADTDRQVVVPSNREHLHVTGASPMYFTSKLFGAADFETRVINLWPTTATGSVDVFAATKPEIESSNDTVPFPWAMMAQGTAWSMLDSDGINPTAAQKAQVMFDQSYSDLITRLGTKSINFGARRTNVPLTIRQL